VAPPFPSIPCSNRSEVTTGLRRIGRQLTRDQCTGPQATDDPLKDKAHKRSTTDSQSCGSAGPPPESRSDQFGRSQMGDCQLEFAYPEHLCAQCSKQRASHGRRLVPVALHHLGHCHP